MRRKSRPQNAGPGASTTIALGLCLVLASARAQAQQAGTDPIARRPVQPLQLSLAECARLALKNDLALGLARMDVFMRQDMYQEERGRFLPFLRSEMGFHRRIDGTELEVVDRRGRFSVTQPTLSAGLSGKMITGLSYDLLIASDIAWTSKKAAVISPQYLNRIELSLTHPLLKDFGITATTAARKTADLARTVAHHEVDRHTLNALAAVVVAYWTLYGLNALKAVFQQSVRQVAAHRSSIDTLPKRLQPDPALASIPEAALANWQVALTKAESARLGAERGLLLLVYGGGRKPSAKLLRRGVRPSDRPAIRPIKASLPTLVQRALKQRPELDSLDTAIKAQEILAAVSENRELPQLDAYMKVGLRSFAGEQTLNDPHYDQVTKPAPAEIRGKYGDAWEQLFEAKFPFISLGLRFQMPVSSALRKQERNAMHGQLNRLKLRRKRLHAGVEVEVREAYLRASNDANLFRQTQLAYEGVATRLQTIEEGFKRKALAPQVVVLAINLLRSAGKELAASAAASMISRARLERTTGTLKEFLDFEPRKGPADPAAEVLEQAGSPPSP